MSVTYTVGDTREVIKGIADGSVDLIASSPPFLALRSYVPSDHASKGDEIGSERNPAEFIDMLLGLTAEWGRVLAAHGSIAIELGDTYSGSGGAGGDYNEGGLRDGQGKVDGSARRDSGRVQYDGQPSIPGRKHYTVAKNGSAWPRAKSLALIPQLYAVALAYGINPLTGQPSPAGQWLVRNVIVWARPNPAVGALGDKVRPSTSYIVIATRSPKRWFDLTAVRGPVSENTHQRLARGVEVAPRNGKSADRDGNYDTMPELATTAGAPPLDAWFDEEDSDLAEATPFDPYDGSHDTWTLTTQPSSLAHYAMWPAKLAERLVLMMCPREVCRVCGEPRRRMEGKAEYVPSATYRGGSMLNGSARVADGVNQWVGDDGASASMVRTAPTIGWTDCDCGDTASPPLSSKGVWNCPPDELVHYDWSDIIPRSNYRPGLVLDPFAGSGTTLAVADLHGRDATGIDFNAANHDLYPARYDEVKRSLYGTPLPDRNQMELAL